MHKPIPFSGDYIEPGSPDYDRVSSTLMRKGAPALVLRPKTADDVALAIRCGIENNMVISVRSGGHSNAGLSTNYDGLVIDLHHFTQIELLDHQKHLVRIGAGATWGQVADFLSPHGLAISSGDTKTVGVGGLISGGGIGWMVRKYGLTIDHIIAAQVVTADGSILNAGHSENPDLFWAVRGGGGNVGIVTHIDVTAEPISEVLWGTITYAIADLPQVLKGWRDAMRHAPEELTTMLMVFPMQFGQMPPTVMIMSCYAGGDEPAARMAIEPLRHLATPTHEDISKQPYSSVLGDAHVPPDMQVINNNMFVQDLNDELIDRICAQKEQIFQIRSVGGAMNRVATHETAFAHRNSEALIVCPAFVPQNATESDVETALKPWRNIAKYSDGAYVNFFSTAAALQIEAAYPAATYKRLSQIKAVYDPQNVFNHNFNVKPAKD